MTNKLNKKNETTEKIIHLLVTSLCNRDCKYCCNKQYDLNDVEYVTEEELSKAEVICITGGEPFLYSNPCEIANYLKRKYKNIKKVYVYTNALELSAYLVAGNSLYAIDGLNISIKTKKDSQIFEEYLKDLTEIICLESNILYVFDNLYPINEGIYGFTKVIDREWQEDFKPATDSIFRKM